MKEYEKVKVKYKERNRVDGYWGGLYFTEGVSDEVERFLAEQFVLNAGERLFEIVELEKKEEEEKKEVKPEPVKIDHPVLVSPQTPDEALKIFGLTHKSTEAQIKARYAAMIAANPASVRPAEYAQITDAYRVLFAPRRGSAGPTVARAPVAQDDDDDAPPAPRLPPPRRPAAPKS